MSSQKNNRVLLSKTNSNTTNTTNTTNINTANKDIISLITLIFTPAIFETLLKVWNINIHDFEAVINTSFDLLPCILSSLNLTPEASEALQFAWLVINKGMIGDFFPKSSVKEYHTEEYKARHKLLTDNIKEIHKTNPKTVSNKNALSIMRKLWDTVSRFLAFNNLSGRAIIQRWDRPYRKNTRINKERRNNIKNTTVSTKIKNKHNSDYLDEETDDEEIQERKFDNIFEDKYEKEMYLEVVVPELARRAAEAYGFDEADDSNDSSDDDLDEWNGGFDAHDYASLKYNH
jgi:hypothetical protein